MLQPATSKNTLASTLKTEPLSVRAKFTRPPFDIEANELIPKEQIPQDHLGRYRTRYCKKGVHLFGEYYALWDGYYTLDDQKVYPVVFTDDRWYIFQKKQNPITKEWEGGVATCLAPAVFQLNPTSIHLKEIYSGQELFYPSKKS